MPGVKFIWDPNKAQANERKHGVNFAEAQNVFQDSYAVVIPDLEHSQTEARFQIVGRSGHRLLMVVYTEQRGDIIRLISAREAGKYHRMIYEDQS